MDYVLLIIFLGLHYIRPQEWSSISLLHPVQVLAVLAVVSILMRERSLRARDLWSTPQDWIISAYFAWTVIASPTPGSTFREILPQVLFYFLGVLALHSMERRIGFLWWWGMFTVVVASLALASLIGFDPFDSLRLTEGSMKGRLVLNLSLFNNPNALGHALVPAIPLLYYTLFWKRLFTKAAIVILAIPLLCIYLTLSKGAFISGAITMLVTFTFGRPRSAQIAIIAFAAMFGGTLLYLLPRMHELDSSKRDEAIQGRVAAFKFGLETMQAKTFGHGLGNFQKEFRTHGPTRTETEKSSGRHQFVQRHYTKAPHSTYNQNGADLGYIGLFLFVGALYACLRTLGTAKTATQDEEMVRRALFGVVVSFAVSSWMVDFCYRPTFFLFTAAVSAMHRHFRGREEAHEQAVETAVSGPAWQPLPPLAPVGIPVQAVLAAQANPQRAASSAIAPAEVGLHNSDDASEEPRIGTINWSRFGWVDFAATFALTQVAIQLWRYAVRNM